MATVYIPALLRDCTGGRETVSAEGGTVRQVIEHLEAQYPGIMARLLVDNELRRGLAVAVGTQIANRGLAQPVPPDGEVHFLPAISGG